MSQMAPAAVSARRSKTLFEPSKLSPVGPSWRITAGDFLSGLDLMGCAKHPWLERNSVLLLPKASTPGWSFQTPLKNIRQLGLLFLIYGKIKHVPNHQPDSTPGSTSSTRFSVLFIVAIYFAFCRKRSYSRSPRRLA